MLRRHVNEASVTTLVETINVAVQRDDEDELSFAKRLCRLNTECEFMYGECALKGRFVEGVHRAARATVREQNTPGMAMAELARVAQTKGDERRWLRLEQRKERTKEREVLGEETQLRRQARLAASSRVSGGAPGYPPPDAPVRVVGAVDAPKQGAGVRHDAVRPGDRTARLPEAGITHTAGSGRRMTLSVPNPGRDGTLAGSVAMWDTGPTRSHMWTHASVTDW